MTKKHFIKIAAALQDSKPLLVAGTDNVTAWRASIDEMYTVFLDLNDRFDVHKFKIACGYYE